MDKYIDSNGLKKLCERIVNKTAKKEDIEKLSNPNLLDNPDFKINQRGKESYNSVGYTVDRWRLFKLSGVNGMGTALVTDDGVRLSNNGILGSAYLAHFFENPLLLNGKTVTVSFEISDLIGSGICGQFSSANQYAFTTPGAKSFSFAWDASPANAGLIFYTSNTNTSYTIKWVKMEFGSIATPFISPNPTVELLKCQRYFQVFDGSIVTTMEVTSNYITFRIPVPVPLRVNPSVEGGYDFSIYVSEKNTPYDDFDYTITSHEQFPYLRIKATKSNHGILPTQQCMLAADNGVYLSADL